MFANPIASNHVASPATLATQKQAVEIAEFNPALIAQSQTSDRNQIVPGGIGAFYGTGINRFAGAESTFLEPFIERLGIGPGGASGYLTFTDATFDPDSQNHLKPGIFLGIPVTQATTEALSGATALNVLLGGGSADQFLMAEFMRRAAQFTEQLNNPNFISALPRGTTVVPNIVLTADFDDVVAITQGRLDEVRNVQIGIGFVIIIPGPDGVGKSAIFGNTRYRHGETMQADDSSTASARNVSLGAILVDVPYLGGANAGVGTSFRAESYDTDAPFAITLPNGESADLPPAVSAALHGLFGSHDVLPNPLDDFDMHELLHALGMSEDMARNFVAGGPSALSALGGVMEVASLVGLMKNPATAPIGIMQGGIRMMEIGDAWVSEVTAAHLAEQLAYVPAVGLHLLRDDMGPEEIAHLATVLSDTVNYAVENGFITSQEAFDMWYQATIDASSQGDHRRHILTQLITGGPVTAAQVARTSGLGGFPDYAGAGPRFALQGTGSEALQIIRGEIPWDTSTPFRPTDITMIYADQTNANPGYLEWHLATGPDEYQVQGLGRPENGHIPVIRRSLETDQREKIGDGALNLVNQSQIDPFPLTRQRPSENETTHGFIGNGEGYYVELLSRRSDADETTTYFGRGPDGFIFMLSAPGSVEEAKRQLRSMMSDETDGMFQF